MGIQVVSGIDNSIPWKIDATSKAARKTRYDSLGREVYEARTVRTYSASGAAFTIAGSAQDVFALLCFGGTIIVKVYSMSVSAIQTTAASTNWAIVKRPLINLVAIANRAIIPSVPNDSNDIQSQSQVQQYTGNPTLGPTTTTYWRGAVYSAAAATAGISDGTGLVGARIDFLALYGKPIAMRFGETLAWNLGGNGAGAGCSAHCSITWTEEEP